MKPKSKPIHIVPIGYVRTDLAESEIKGNRSKVVSEIEILKEYEDGLRGLEEYTHLIIVFWMNQTPEEERQILTVRPWNDPDSPEVGVFAIRRRTRPNPIGISIVELKSVKDNVLTVKGLDALNSTPILDIKSYDFADRPDNIRVPDWWIERKAHRKN